MNLTKSFSALSTEQLSKLINSNKRHKVTFSDGTEVEVVNSTKDVPEGYEIVGALYEDNDGNIVIDDNPDTKEFSCSVCTERAKVEQINEGADKEDIAGLNPTPATAVDGAQVEGIGLSGVEGVTTFSQSTLAFLASKGVNLNKLFSNAESPAIADGEQPTADEREAGKEVIEKLDEKADATDGAEESIAEAVRNHGRDMAEDTATFSYEVYDDVEDKVLFSGTKNACEKFFSAMNMYNSYEVYDDVHDKVLFSGTKDECSKFANAIKLFSGDDTDVKTEIETKAEEMMEGIQENLEQLDENQLDGDSKEAEKELANGTSTFSETKKLYTENGDLSQEEADALTDPNGGDDDDETLIDDMESFEAALNSVGEIIADDSNTEKQFSVFADTVSGGCDSFDVLMSMPAKF